VEAKEKAQNAAKIAGFKLGKIINYSENMDGYPVPMMRSLDAKGGTEAPTQVETGSKNISITVTLSYELQ